MNGMNSITDVAIVTLAQNCHELKSIRFSNTWSSSGNECGLTDATLIALGQGCPLLQKIGVFSNPNFTDAGLQALAKGCPLLKKLEFQYTPGIGDTGVKAILDSCPRLTKFTISHEEGNFSVEVLNQLKARGLHDWTRRIMMD